MLNLKNISLNLGNRVLLDRANLTIERGERICLLGRNGEGKSTLLKVISGEIQADDGELQTAPGWQVAQLQQDVPAGLTGTVFDVVADGLGEAGKALSQYFHVLADEPENLNKQAKLQAIVDATNGWGLDAKVEAMITRLNLPAESLFSDLSGGLKRRTLLARALVSEPDMLLLDEPTNHLDIASITQLEEFLNSWHGALLFITHDRAFLRRLAGRIIELDRGQLTSWMGNYDDYLKHKAEALAAEEKSRAEFDKKLAQEEVWIRKGVQARRTRNEGRVRALKALRTEYAERRNRSGTAKIELQESEKSGKLVVEAKEVGFAHDGEELLIKPFSTTILRGDKVGIIGPNGVGKTTLVNLLLDRLQPTVGTLKQGTKLEVAYFDQLREALDPNAPVFHNIGDGKEFVEINGARVHVMSYLQDFLFTPDRARSPAKALSGGERSRLLLARLFSSPFNLLVLDEPTNDLDLETLDLLEEKLLDYNGTLLLVSHDREFIDRVVTRSLVFEGNGKIGDYVGGYSDWLRQKPDVETPKKAAKSEPNKNFGPVNAEKKAASLSNEEKRELDKLPKLLEKLEKEQTELGIQLGDPELFSGDKTRVIKIQQRLNEIETELEDKFQRWELLEEKRS